MERRGSRLSRRAFVGGAGITGATLLAGCGQVPWHVSAQPSAKVARIGWLHDGLPDDYTRTQVQAFREGLGALGYAGGYSHGH